jgi:hypothetical protein
MPRRALTYGPSIRSAALPVLAIAIGTVAGCLSLGGRTTYVQSSPEQEARVHALETRVRALEQYIQTVPAAGRPAAEPLSAP